MKTQLRAGPAMRRVIALLAVPAPSPLKRFLYVRLLGWRVDPGARVGLSYLAADHVVLERGARIGHMTVIRDLVELTMGTNAVIGNWNWITAAPSLLGAPATDAADRQATFRIAREAAVTSRHYLDCSGGIEIGELATVAGVRSTFMTHQIDAPTARMITAPISIGAWSLMSSNVKVTPGATVPARSIVAMGSVVTRGLSAEGVLYAGVPARAVRHGLGGGRYFMRERGPAALPRDGE